MPSRLLWFLIGAGSASWWMMSKDRDFDRRHWGHCRRVDYPAPRDPSNNDTAAPGGPGPNNDSGSQQCRPHPWQTREHWEWRWHQRNRQENNNGASQWPWEASDERFDEMTKQASEAVRIVGLNLRPSSNLLVDDGVDRGHSRHCPHNRTSFESGTSREFNTYYPVLTERSAPETCRVPCGEGETTERLGRKKGGRSEESS